MPDIHHDFPINAPASSVFDAVATPAGLNAWWTKTATGAPERGSEYRFDFGSGFEWRAVVTRCVPSREFALEMTFADDDWIDTRVEFLLAESDGGTTVQFSHTGWSAANAHFRTTSYCWAMYLRLLKRYVETGEVIGCEHRLEA